MKGKSLLTGLKSLCLCTLLSGCATGDWAEYNYGPGDWLNSHGPGWLATWQSTHSYEKLVHPEIHVHVVESLARVCGNTYVRGCAQLNVQFNRCDIYIGERSHPDVIAHEQRHCHGWTHHEIDYRFWATLSPDRQRAEIKKTHSWYPMRTGPSEALAAVDTEDK